MQCIAGMLVELEATGGWPQTTDAMEGSQITFRIINTDNSDQLIGTSQYDLDLIRPTISSCAISSDNDYNGTGNASHDPTTTPFYATVDDRISITFKNKWSDIDLEEIF